MQFVTVSNIKHNRNKRVKQFQPFCSFFVLLNRVSKQFFEGIEEAETYFPFCIQFMLDVTLFINLYPSQDFHIINHYTIPQDEQMKMIINSD